MCWLTAKGGCGDPSCDDCAQEWGRKKEEKVTATRTKTVTIHGRTEFHSETGTEGGYWAVQDNDSLHGADALVGGKCPWTPGMCPVESGDWHEHGRYEGLHVLRDGDQLTIYRSDGETEMWKGTIELIQHPLFSESAHGLWIHADQAGEPRDIWAQLFLLELPCTLVREVPE